jgi:hypothetical protein
MPDNLMLLGALFFGMVIGWQVYIINRYRTAAVDFGDLATVIGIVGGGAVLNLFPSSTALFGAYGIGLAIGYFLYFLVLVAFVRRSENFDIDWFLDGRRRMPKGDYIIPEGVRTTVAAMGEARPAEGAAQGGPRD